MVKFIVLALLLIVTGCSTNNTVTQKQVNPKQTTISNHAHTAAPTPVITQASSTTASRITTKDTQNTQFGLPSNLLDLIQTPTANPSNPSEDTTSEEKVPTTPTNQTQEIEKDSSQFAEQVLDLVNQERSKAGLSSLSMSEELSNMAMVKAQDMYNNNYFDHNSPTHGSPFDMMKEFGITYNTAGENIAKGQTSPTQVMKDWMNSPGHKANILNNGYTQIGISYYNNAWVQEFTG